MGQVYPTEEQRIRDGLNDRIAALMIDLETAKALLARAHAILELDEYVHLPKEIATFLGWAQDPMPAAPPSSTPKEEP